MFCSLFAVWDESECWKIMGKIHSCFNVEKFGSFAFRHRAQPPQGNPTHLRQHARRRPSLSFLMAKKGPLSDPPVSLLSLWTPLRMGTHAYPPIRTGGVALPLSLGRRTVIVTVGISQGMQIYDRKCTRASLRCLVFLGLISSLADSQHIAVGYWTLHASSVDTVHFAPNGPDLPEAQTNLSFLMVS